MSTATTSTTNDPHAATLASLERQFGAGTFPTTRFPDNVRVYVPAARLIEVLGFLKDQGGFQMLAELGCVDYLGYPGREGSRFEVHYVLLNHDTTERVVLKVGVDDPDPTLSSAVPLWLGA